MQGCFVLPFICHLLHPSSSPSSSLPFSPSHLLLLLLLVFFHVPPLLPSIIPYYSSTLSFLLPPFLCSSPDEHPLVEHLHFLAGVGHHHSPLLQQLGVLHLAHLPPHLPQGHTGHRHPISQWATSPTPTSLPSLSFSSLLSPSSPSPILLLSHPPPLSFFPLLYPIFPRTCTGRSLVWRSLCSHGSGGCLLGLCHRLLQA